MSVTTLTNTSSFTFTRIETIRETARGFLVEAGIFDLEAWDAYIAPGLEERNICVIGLHGSAGAGGPGSLRISAHFTIDWDKHQVLCESAPEIDLGTAAGAKHFDEMGVCRAVRRIATIFLDGCKVRGLKVEWFVRAVSQDRSQELALKRNFSICTSSETFPEGAVITSYIGGARRVPGLDECSVGVDGIADL